MIQWTLESSQATEALGGSLALAVDSLRRGCLFYLSGDLGAGKTTLVRGFLRALGYRGAVKSPTYTLVEPYTLKGLQVFHFDLYRLTDPEELEFIGLRDFLSESSVLLVEWPERGAGVLPVADVEIEINYAGTARRCRIDANSVIGKKILAALKGFS